MVIAGVVRAGVPGPQNTGQHLPLAAHEQRVEAEPALVVPGRVLLLGMDADRGRIEIEDHTVRSRSRLPRPLASQGACPADPVDLRLPDREQQPPGGGHRRDITEQCALPREHSEVRDTPAAISGHHRQIAKNAARIMGRAALAGARQGPAQGICEPEALSREREQSAPCAR